MQNTFVTVAKFQYSAEAEIIKGRLESDDIGAYSISDDGEPIACPNCGKNHIELYSTITNFKSLVSFLIGFITGTLPFSTRYQYKCEDCKTEFPFKS